MVSAPQPEPGISKFLAERVAAGDFPSAVYLVARRDKVVLADALGLAVVEPYRIETTLDTVYDLASLTKPLITGLLCARRIEAGELTLDSAVAHYLPEFDRTDKQAITVRHLLTHTSGLPAWRPLYILSEGERDRAAGVIANETLEYAPGTHVVYSDLGFITLGFLLERITRKQIAELAQEEIINRLNLTRTFFNPGAAMQTGIAACERGNAYERETCRDIGGPTFSSWREHLLWGEVHDGNAHFLGGAAGHAGLFSDARDTLRLAEQFLPRQSEMLSGETCQLFRENMTEGLEQARAIAWQLASTLESTAGPSLSADSYGHTGFTGASCWIDPQREAIFLLLTNRTHVRPLPFANINSVRREFHSRAVAALDRT